MICTGFHFTEGLRVSFAYADETGEFAAIKLTEGATEHADFGLFFHRVSDIETLVAALQKLGNDFAAAQPKPTYTDAALADFGCGADAIARAEADAEARDLVRVTGRDPHQCVRCGAVDCVCAK